MSGTLKRKFEEVDASSPCSSPRETDEEVSGSESGDSGDSIDPFRHFTPASILKREKRVRRRNVHFEKVTVYYFSRRQGFTSVPSQGGSTLGMAGRHSSVRQYTLGEFALEQERIHRDMLRDHLKEEKLNSIKLKLTKNGTVDSEEASLLTVDDISDDDIDLDNTEVDEYFFLQPLTTKKRRALLRSSGVRKIDVGEKHELRAIRVSREDCGCDCRAFCDPETCACSMAGIKCQVDRMSFPCGCTKEGCSNTAGRIEFNPIRVRTHFLHTIMKLELEKSREQQQDGYHGDDGPLAQAQHGLEYPLGDGVPSSALRRLQAAEELDEPLEDEDEDEEEEEEEEEDDDDEDDDEDSNSLCSGLTDSSTQSLADSDSEEDEEDEDDKSDGFEERMGVPPVSHTEVVPLSSVLCYPESVAARDNRAKANSYFSSSPAEYYQMQTPGNVCANGSGGQTPEPYGETSPFQDRVTNREDSVSLSPFSMTSELYAGFSRHSEGQYGGRRFPAADQENDAQPNGVKTGVRSRMEFQNFLKTNSQEHCVGDGNCFLPAQPGDATRGPSESPSLTGSKKNPPSLETFPKVAPV